MRVELSDYFALIINNSVILMCESHFFYLIVGFFIYFYTLMIDVAQPVNFYIQFVNLSNNLTPQSKFRRTNDLSLSN